MQKLENVFFFRSKLYTSECWIDSATQIFFAYSIGTGALPALGSYNKFYHNCVKSVEQKKRDNPISPIRDTVITCLVNTGTCLLAGTVTFSILGHMAHNQGVDVASVSSLRITMIQHLSHISHSSFWV